MPSFAAPMLAWRREHWARPVSFVARDRAHRQRNIGGRASTQAPSALPDAATA
jgi:hypothetical protein